MATRTLESRFERMSVNDENDPGDGSKTYLKSKVISQQTILDQTLKQYSRQLRQSQTPN